MDIPKLLWDKDDLAAALKISPSKAAQMMREGQVPTVRLAGGRLLRVPAAALMAMYGWPCEPASDSPLS